MAKMCSCIITYETVAKIAAISSLIENIYELYLFCFGKYDKSDFVQSLRDSYDIMNPYEKAAVDFILQFALIGCILRLMSSSFLLNGIGSVS